MNIKHFDIPEIAEGQREFKIREIDYFLVPIMIGVCLDYIEEMGLLDRYKQTMEYLLGIFPDNKRLIHKYKVLIDNHFQQK